MAVTVVVGREQPEDEVAVLRERLGRTVATVRVRNGRIVLRETFKGVLEVARGRSLILPPDTPPGVVTSLAVRDGSPVTDGDVIATVQGAPVVALQGPLPTYRDLRAGFSGPDVSQLHDALLRLGVRCPCGTRLLKSEIRALRAAIFARTAAALDRDAWRDSVPLGGIIWVPSLPVTVDRGLWRVGRPAGKAIATTRRSSRRVRGTRVPAESQIKSGQRATVSGVDGGGWTTHVERVTELQGGKRTFVLRGTLPERVRGKLTIRVTTLKRRGRALIVPASAVGTSPSGQDRLVVVRGRGRVSKAVTVVADLGETVAVRGRGLNAVEDVVVTDGYP